jgi:Fe(3+) dicitrate transport protein
MQSVISKPYAIVCAFIFGLVGIVSVTHADKGATFFEEEITIVGERQLGEQVAGSAHYVSAEQIEQLGHNDIQRIIRQIPGVSVQIEDGYGLRPNISIRGVATERSGRITLLEDNVLIAPAPYSAPSAYYFPTIGRMSAIEVLKGPAAITQGPYTIGGALNMISVPIPEVASGKVTLEAGEDSTYRLHAHYGARTDSGFGYLVETHQWQSDGFQSIDRGGDTGLDVEDYTLKLSYAPDTSNHRVELKLQYAEQDSDQTYLGLTDGDFKDDAFRRYGLSALDNIATQHEQVILRYEWDISDRLSFNATAYNNTHERSWFKTEGIDFDGSADAESFSRTSWFDVVQAINSGESLGGLDSDQLQGILDGDIDTPAGSLQLRANDREYFSRGIQLGLDWTVLTGDWSHSINVGLRMHEDEEDRLQRNSSYSQVSGQLVRDDIGLLGNAGNRVQEAQALAIHIYDRIEIGSWTLTPGLRYEDIEQDRTRWEIRPGNTLDPASRSADNLRDTRSNDTSVWLPGMGVIYSFNDEFSLFAGIHKGFTAPSNAPGVDEEEAINYELGLRFNDRNLRMEAAYFLSDYDNLLGECTASSGSDCEIGDAFNGDAVTVQGFEMLLGSNLNPRGQIAMPLEIAYTYIDSKFDSDIASTDFFGDVSKGDPIPYIPENQLNVSLGLVGSEWDVYLAANYVDEVCVRASCGAFEQTDSTLSVDLSGSYNLNQVTELFARVENLTGEEDILGRQPYGARPNKDTTASVGVRFTF